MSSGNRKRPRVERLAASDAPRSVWERFWRNLQSGPVVLRMAIAVGLALGLIAVTGGWDPPLGIRLGQVPSRNLVVNTPFSEVDLAATEVARERASDQAIAVYNNDPKPLVELEARLVNELTQLAGATSMEAVAELWANYEPERAEGAPNLTDEQRKEQFERFRSALATEGVLAKTEAALNEVFAPLAQHGLLDELPEGGSAKSITVRSSDQQALTVVLRLNEVLVATATEQLRAKLEQKLPNLDLANGVFARLHDALPSTLKINEEATLAEQERLVAEVPNELRKFAVGDVLVPAATAVDAQALALLELEHAERRKLRGWGDRVARVLALLGMFVAAYTLAGFYLHALAPQVLADLSQYLRLLATVAVTVLLMLLTWWNSWQAEVIPLLLFAMTATIAYGQSLALLLTAGVALVAVVSFGLDLWDAITLLATSAGAILVLDGVRTRSKLLVVGFAAALVALLTTLGVGTLAEWPITLSAQVALRYALWAVIAGSLMTCLLPLVERVFGVLTDLSLLELGDPAHALLQELVRRAPGTYNHSINVASLAEAAAEAIGARGLLVRVGAYFHDIGKMLKPGYFVENQGQGGNRHDTLLPAMSTLVIIAHVKDGADLARQHGLPERIIDFIQQHHGTTLVEYFYHQANERRDPTTAKVDESSFRYPGPKPQSKEAGVLMIADAVESASRALVEPTPARIESLVEDLTRKRLLDGQFDECGLTLEEVHQVGQSLVKSLTAVYHGRVKYPDQESA